MTGRTPCLINGKGFYLDMEEYIRTMREKGLKATPKRRAVIELFLKGGRSLSPAEVYQSLIRKIRPLGVPTVYRILEDLREAGILIRIPSEERLVCYSLCRMPDRHHHHFICRKCRRVEEVEYCNFEEISRLVEERLKCRAETHFLQIEGLCSRCL